MFKMTDTVHGSGGSVGLSSDRGSIAKVPYSEEQTLKMIKESLHGGADGESDYEANVTHVFVVLGASVCLGFIFCYFW